MRNDYYDDDREIDRMVNCWLFGGLAAGILFSFIISAAIPPQNKQNKHDDLVLCCFYRQHFHEAMCGKDGCVIGAALPGGVPPTVTCSKQLECSMGEYSTGYFLDSFRLNCKECLHDMPESRDTRNNKSKIW